jgi:hypothetical protein
MPLMKQREQLELILRDSPSLKPYLADIFAECYQKAVRGTLNETNLPKETFQLIVLLAKNRF